jgi:hypothetical protein
MKDEDANVSLPIVNVAEREIETNLIQAAFIAQGAVTWEGRIQELRKIIQTDHLKGNRLSTTAVEHAIQTPGVDPCRGIASRNYQIPDSLKGELIGIIDHMLRDTIRHSNSPWNSPILLVKKRRMHPRRNGG